MLEVGETVQILEKCEGRGAAAATLVLLETAENVQLSAHSYTCSGRLDIQCKLPSIDFT